MTLSEVGSEVCLVGEGLVVSPGDGLEKDGLAGSPGMHRGLTWHLCCDRISGIWAEERQSNGPETAWGMP